MSSNAKLPAPNDLCDDCGKMYREHFKGPTTGIMWCNKPTGGTHCFRAKPLQVEGPTDFHCTKWFSSRQRDKCQTQCDGCKIEYEEMMNRSVEAGAEATGPDEYVVPDAVKNDPVAMFASQEDLLMFSHFYDKGAEATGKLEQQLYTEDELQEAWEAGASYASDYEHGYRGKDYKTFKKQLDEYRNSNKKA